MPEIRPVAFYKATCLATGRAYVGICTIRRGGWPRRWKDHVCLALKDKFDYPLHRAIRKYGPEMFEVENLGTAPSWEAACALEQRLIAQERTLTPDGYNICAGGLGRRNVKHRPESIEKMRQAALGKKASPETRRKMSEARKRNLAETDLRARISASLKRSRYLRTVEALLSA